MTKFLRRVWSRYSKFGKGRKKKQKWKKPTGRHNKMREKRKGYPAVVSKGYKNDSKVRGKIDGKTPMLVYNLNDLSRAGKENVIIIGKIGARKKTEIIKKAEEMKIKILNPKKLKKKQEKKDGSV